MPLTCVVQIGVLKKVSRELVESLQSSLYSRVTWMSYAQRSVSAAPRESEVVSDRVRKVFLRAMTVKQETFSRNSYSYSYILHFWYSSLFYTVFSLQMNHVNHLK